MRQSTPLPLMERRVFLKYLGVTCGGIISGLVAHLDGAQVQKRTGTRSIPAEANALHGKVLSAFPSGAQRWIHNQGRYLAQTPGAEESAGFRAATKSYAAQFPNCDIIATLFAVFKEALEQTESDKAAMLSQLAEMNRMSQAIGDYLRYLTESTAKLKGKKDADPICEAGRLEVQQGIKKLSALRRSIGIETASPLSEPTTIGEASVAIKAVTLELKEKDRHLKSSIEITTSRVEKTQVRSDELFTKMMDAMSKIPPGFR